ncbi:MAG TPA: anti-sigma factor [Candidatus Krumholzibacteria bacterium]|nr:anti-sigma factor [Candidatus Krumholzibacteria bacterium]HPD73157.1 anti-sigma factor [Candidatus Krumholzibacteria bacterium]HRY41965.1 anti-sigma factor [Candidatus Krumholzibacteria bacterium]
MNGNPFDPRERQRRFADPDLTRRILDRTSGRACGRSEVLLGARWDGELDRLDAELLAGHLAHCAACRELATILERLQPMLPSLAEREPGPSFTARVLDQTSRRRPRAARRTSRLVARLEDLAIRLQAGLRQAWGRPRFALEAAWTAAALVSLLVWSPLAPEAASRRADAIVQAGAGVVPEANARLGRAAAAAAATGREYLEPAVAWARTGLAAFEVRFSALADALRDRLDRDEASDTTTNP